MRKGGVSLVSEQCTEVHTDFMPGQQIIPKGSSKLDNVVSTRPSLSAKLCEGLALPFAKTWKQQGYPLAIRFKHANGNDYAKMPPIILSFPEAKMTFPDSSASFVSAIGKLNRSFSVPFACDLPNEAVKSDGAMLDKVLEKERDAFLPFLEQIFGSFAANGQTYIRKCPLGQNGGATGGGASTNNSCNYATSSTMQQWVTGMGYGGGHASSPPGGGDDDDPWKNYRPHNLTPGHYLEQEQFQSSHDIDKLTADILRDGELFRELGLELPELQTLPDPNSANVDYSDPAPMTPGPMTPYMPMMSPVPAQANSDVRNLLEIQALLTSPNPRMSVPQQPTSPDYTASNTEVGHHTANKQPRPPVSPAPFQHSQMQPSSSSDFFATTSYQQGDQSFIAMSVKSQKDPQAYHALEFIWNLFKKYETVLERNCTMPIAVQGKAKLCGMKMDMHGNLLFNIPANCISLADWNAQNGDLRSRHLVIQQIVNMMVVLFQGENNLSFWGSCEVFVAPNAQVHLYVDFNKSLSIQKVYAHSGGQANPRLEDFKFLKGLFDMLLKPYLNSSLVSPQLSNILSTFQQLVNTQSVSVDHMAQMARVLGERRICRMQAQIYGYDNAQYTIYSVEHEPVGNSLGILKNMICDHVRKPCMVLHGGDRSPVSVTEISARDSHNHQFLLVPQDCSNARMAGILYIE